MIPAPSRALPLVASALLLVVLAGCGGASTPTPSTTSTSEPTPGETVVAAAPGSRPEPRTDAVCADLVTSALLDSTFGEPITLAGPERTAQYIGILADEWMVLQAGGLACEWMSAESIVASEGQFSYQGVRVYLLPAPADLWAPYSAAEAGGTDRDVTCYDSSCTLNRYFPAGWWLSVSGSNTADGFADAEAELTPVFDAIAGVVAALPAPTSPWSPPTPATALPATCDGLITGSQVATVLGIPGPAIPETPAYPSIYNAVETVVGGDTCRWLGADAFTDLVQISWLPGGVWAMDARTAAAEAMSGTPATTLAVPGVDAPGVYVQHVDFESLSVNIGDNWVIIIGGHDGIGSLTSQNALVALAGQIATNFP